MFNRRDFIKSTVAGGAAAMAMAGVFALREQHAAAAEPAPAAKRAFMLTYAPHFGMFGNLGGKDLIDQIKFMADQGFTALEDNGLCGRSAEEQDRIAKEMARLNMTMGVFIVNMGTGFGTSAFANPEKGPREAFLNECRAAVKVAKRVNAKWMTVVPGRQFTRLQPEYQTQLAVELLKQASAIFEPHGLVMVIEALNFRDHPDQFLQRIGQAYLLCKSVSSPACKILFDIYHQQITEGDLIPNIDRAWSEIGYFQVGDNPGRAEPGTGEVNFRNVFRHIHSKGFKGVIGMEHVNSRGGAEGEQAVIDAYVGADTF